MPTVHHTLNAWADYREKLVDLDLVARSTAENQGFICGILSEQLGHHELADLRKSHVELYVGTRLRTCKPITVQGELNVLRQVLNWAVDEQLLVSKPRLPTVKVPTTEAPLPSDEAFRWVLKTVPRRHALALEFMMLTGLSPHELARVKVEDAGPAPGSVVVVGYPLPIDGIGIGLRPDFAVKQESRRRFVRLSGRARDLWFEAAEGSQHGILVFPSVAAMQKAIRRAVDTPAAPWHLANDLPGGLDGITPKLMRKWFASKVASEQPEHVLQRLMGHAPGSPITRKHYVRSNDDQLQAAVGGLKA